MLILEIPVFQNITPFRQVKRCLRWDRAYR